MKSTVSCVGPHGAMSTATGIAMTAEAGLGSKQVHRLWESMVGANVLADYFAHLATWYSRRELSLRIANGVLCLFAAFLAFRSGDLAVLVGWLAAAAGTVAVIEMLWRPGDKRSEATMLHAAWSRLGIEYEELWSRTYEHDAGKVLQELERRGADHSERATRLPLGENRMNRQLKASAARVHPHFESYSSLER